MQNKALLIRLRAGGIHLAISALVALAAMGLIFLVWYPGVLARAQGVNFLVLILIGVDVALGPMLTTIIFNPAKPWRLLRFDLSVIGLVQLAALVYGVHAIAAGRPVFVVFNIDVFDAVAAGELDPRSLARAQERGNADISWFGPRIVAARLPTDPEASQKLLFSSISGGPDLQHSPEWYLPYAEDKETVLAKMRPLAELRKLNDLSAEDWEKLIAELGGDESGLGYLPMRAKAKDGAVIVDAKTAEILGIRLLQPKWETGSKPAPERPSPTTIAPGVG